ncbi:quinone-dependent dihydroorotate dehydrogenase [Limibaculum sp. FT325]|uniref:quinone-dependent dihydroorotate dehydrogenase n=1 Tax=Thermohalobaculum sediminis TaxID=2939436 RepID=UPI0020BE2E15|nr:quinone-dependent dihydroorotate dehydrogenase [Limibaculum sediminis]MCL5777733.1 quinone-dependent dihydroorotate dehydrogenase [Limibaculum sediminis]
MRLVERAGLAALRLADPERAHGIALAALNAGLGPRGGPVTSPRLATRLAGLALPNPVGIAAGFDKNATAVRPILAAGPGFLEVGAVTPRPQPGNPRPRLFRLAQDRAAINRFGFNNDGMEAIGRRLAAARGAGVVGVNLGANKDTADKAEDYAAVLGQLYPHADFFTVNVSSPNTERLRDLQGRAALDRLLGRVTAEWTALGRTKPLFLKIAPDLSETELADIAELAEAHALSGIVATNTTLVREGLASPHRAEAGGLSGAPLRNRAQAVMLSLRRLTGGRLPLIGVGGIASAEDAYARIRAGASAVQLYTAMVYDGISLPGRIALGLDALLARDGFASVAEAVGADQ